MMRRFLEICLDKACRMAARLVPGLRQETASSLCPHATRQEPSPRFFDLEITGITLALFPVHDHPPAPAV
jgi:hypothetical protein